MTYITIKTKETNANVEINPPIVLSERSHISLVDIKIPEKITKSFTFLTRQAIAIGPSDGQPKMTLFDKGVHNIFKLQHIIRNSSMYEDIGFNIETINKNLYTTTKSNTVRVSSELAQILNIPKSLPPFSHIKISSDEKYLIYCNLVEMNSSYSLWDKVSPSDLLAVVPSQDGCYPELTIKSGKYIINNLALEILTEKFEVLDFGDKEIIYVLKIW